VIRRSLLLTLLLLAPALATNTSEDARLKVTLFDGATHEGEVKLTREKLEVKGGRRVKVRYREVAALADPTPPTPDALRAEHTRRAERVAEGDAAAWARVGEWAKESGLADEARADFEKAIAIDPDHGAARKGLGQAKADDGAWVDGAQLVLARRATVRDDDHDGLVELARFAQRAGQDALCFQLLQDVLHRDTYHAAAIELSRPFTAAYRQQTTLAFPLRGRWYAGPDSTRHHQRKAWAVYALDLMRVDAEGRDHTGDGRKLEDYLAWDQPFYAVAAGRVVEVRDGNPDNPARTIPEGAAEKHNGVSIDHGNGEVSWYVHAKNGTITVKVGDDVQAGQELGRVGNSGASAVPHLHYTLVAFGNISVPWACDGYTLIAPDGTPVPVTRACPREGWTIEAR
jgi:hypothetical protein